MIKLARTNTKSKAEIAKDLGVLPSTFYAWSKKSEVDKNGNIITDNKVTCLRKKLKDVKIERDILKKAMAIFSKK